MARILRVDLTSRKSSWEEMPERYLQDLGRNVVVAERAFNRLAGFGPGDDRLPGFHRNETLSPGGNVWDVPDEDLDKMFS